MPPDGWVSCRKLVVPSAERILKGFSVLSIGTSESRGQKKSPHFSPCATSVHLNILGSFLQVVLLQVESEQLCLLCNEKTQWEGGTQARGDAWPRLCENLSCQSLHWEELGLKFLEELR